MKKFIIKESEKKAILELYGLIKESVDDEVIGYFNFYINSKSCSQIADDLEAFKRTPEYNNLSKEDKKNLDNGITGLRNPPLANLFSKEIECGRCECVKDYMKKELLNQLSGPKRQNVLDQSCVMSKTTPPPKPLSYCQKSQQNPVQNNQQQVSTPAQQNQQQVSTPAQQNQQQTSSETIPVDKAEDQEVRSKDPFGRIKKQKTTEKGGYKFGGF